MKILEKHVELGKYNFKLATDRDIAVKSFKAFPDVIEYIIENEEMGQTDAKLVMDAIRNDKLDSLLEMEEKLGELARFVLPMMLKKAKEELDAEEIIEYATKNYVIDDFNIGIVEFLFLGFMQRGLGQPKIKFSMI